MEKVNLKLAILLVDDSYIVKPVTEKVFMEELVRVIRTMEK